MLCRVTHVALALLSLFAVATPQAVAAQRLWIAGGVVLLELDPIVQVSITDQSSSLRWTQVRTASKITVNTVSPGQAFELYVSADRPRGGDAVGEITLRDGDPDQDFILDVGVRRAGHATLAYRAATRAEYGFGQEVHTVTYTITIQ